MGSSYPQMLQRNRTHWESAEQLDGIPDYILTRVGREWHGKLRTSALTWRFSSLQAALAWTGDQRALNPVLGR